MEHINVSIEVARAELHALVQAHGFNLQHENVQAASQRLDALIVLEQKLKLERALKRR